MVNFDSNCPHVQRPQDITADGVYLMRGKDGKPLQTGETVIVVRIRGVFHAIEVAQPLNLAGFHPDVRLYGPHK